MPEVTSESWGKSSSIPFRSFPTVRDTSGLVLGEDGGLISSECRVAQGLCASATGILDGLKSSWFSTQIKCLSIDSALLSSTFLRLAAYHVSSRETSRVSRY